MITMTTGTSTGHQLIGRGSSPAGFRRDRPHRLRPGHWTSRVRVDHLDQVAHSATLAEAVTGTRSLSMPTLRLLVADAQATG